MVKFIFLLTFIAVFITIYQVVKLFFQKKKPIERLQFYAEGNKFKTINLEKNKENNKFFAKFIKTVLSRTSIFNKYMDSQKSLLIRARINIKLEEYVGVKIAVCLIWVMLAYIIFNKTSTGLILGIISMPIAWILPDQFIKFKINKRLKLINDQLGDALRIISNALKAGYGFFQAIDNMTKEMTGPISEEFEVVINEINLGETVDNALENLADRVKHPELSMVVTAVLIQRQAGGNLSEVLDNIAETIRNRISLNRELNTVTAQGKMSALIVSLLPVVLFALSMLVNYEVYSILILDRIGQIMLAISLVMELTGIYFIRKLISIKI